MHWKLPPKPQWCNPVYNLHYTSFIRPWMQLNPFV